MWRGSNACVTVLKLVPMWHRHWQHHGCVSRERLQIVLGDVSIARADADADAALLVVAGLGC
jgi:hypothetical protein